ncbi:MAG: hypothetical protein ACPLRM_06595, partial [Anaerolineae bacterium]
MAVEPDTQGIERAVIAAAAANKSALSYLKARLRPEDFSPALRKVWLGLLSSPDASVPPDLLNSV